MISSSGIGRLLAGGVKGVERAGGVDDGSPGIDGDGHAQCFGELLLGRTKLPGGCGMDRDTAVAAQANGDRKCDQLASLVVEVTGLLTGAAQGDIALDGIGVEFAKAADPGDELLTVVVPVVHMHNNLLFHAIEKGIGRVMIYALAAQSLCRLDQ